MAVPLGLRFWLFALLLTAAVWALLREPAAPSGPKQLPEPLIGEPDLYLEQAQISQYGEPGRLKYELLASRIRHFEADAITRLTLPDLTLYNSRNLPWQSTAGQGFIRQEIGPSGQPEELVFLREDVLLRQRDTDGRFLRLRTEHLYVYPDRQYAQTDQSVTIDTDVGRTKAAGMTADLAAGRISLSADAKQRVQTIVLKDQFK